MVTMPTLPTDNLYKFIAVSGVFIATIGAIWPFVFAHQTGLWAISRQGELIGRVHTLQSAQGQVVPNNQYIAGLEENFTLEKKLRLGAVHIWFWTGALLLPIGLIVAGFGFRQWWIKVQRIQDQLLEIELIQANRLNLSEPSIWPG